MIIDRHYKSRGVAQFGSVSEWGSEGRRFKSSRPDQENQGVTAKNRNPFLFVLEISPTFLPLWEFFASNFYLVGDADYIPRQSAAEYYSSLPDAVFLLRLSDVAQFELSAAVPTSPLLLFHRLFLRHVEGGPVLPPRFVEKPFSIPFLKAWPSLFP
jgi:hypothetical protein